MAATTGFLGIISAVVYLVMTPKHYEASAQIAMWQIASNNNSPKSFTPEELEA
jgi:uncharacterized protein involved in exopolysaccharide biosynthesis